MYELDTRTEFIQTRLAQVQRDWPTNGTSPRYALSAWLIRLGRRLAPEPRSSGFPHKALPRC
jgi:hypothetical protein